VITVISGCLSVCWGVIVLAVALLACVWIYQDAEARGKNGALWVVILVLTHVFGLVLWLIVRPPRRTWSRA